MTTNSLRRQYDILNPEERFIALTQARMRHDKSEVQALLDSSPRNAFSVSHCLGLIVGFSNLAPAHIIGQLANGILLCGALSFVPNDLMTENPSMKQSIRIAQEQILEAKLAWQATCHKYGVDPDHMLLDWPGSRSLSATEEAAEALQRIDPVELTGLDQAIAEYARLIERARREFE